MNEGIVIALIGLIVVITAHIIVIARWSGRIDGYILASSENIVKMDLEITRLRDARHDSDGVLQRHDGILHQLMHERIVPGRTGGQDVAG